MCVFEPGITFVTVYVARAGARALIGGGGGVYSYIRVMPN